MTILWIGYILTPTKTYQSLRIYESMLKYKGNYFYKNLLIIIFPKSNVYFSTYSPSTFMCPFPKGLLLLVHVSLHWKFNFIIGSKSFPSYGLSEWTEQVKIAWRQVRTIGEVWQYLPIHILQCSCCHSGDVQTGVVVEETDAFDWLTFSFWTKDWLYSVFK
jgi:hypothetical protein